ncbi:G patch domain-containing protein 11 isoform X2 [Sitophilus oryzae]|uniref:G patch domain-containing protein 11 n=1 Tax=Sitophilus oryzae TaxID=7048 RepID=A0A6J2Y0N3_SITOR|nr:G patch domain-containing protein 11 isoform X2 [Sitophilus oryzae]
MSEDSEDDDYMSFVVVDCEDVRPSLLVNREKRKHELYKKKFDAPNKKQKGRSDMERENREKGLATAITSDNKGFQMLEKMGFKSGESLGKTNCGIKEPIDIVLKQGTSGVGRESHIKEIIEREYKLISGQSLGKSRSSIKEPIDIVLKQGTSGVGRESHIKEMLSRKQPKIKNLKHYETQFRLANKERTKISQIRKDFFKAQRICEELDYRINVKDPTEDFYWTKATIKKRRKMEKQSSEDTDSSDEDDEDFEQYVTEENLFAIIDYIRSKHLYCLYCVITGIDIEDLKENCPGPYRIDHDNEID